MVYGRVSDGVTLVWPGNPSLLGAFDETQDLFACLGYVHQKRNWKVVAVGCNKNLQKNRKESEPVSSSERAHTFLTIKQTHSAVLKPR